MDIVHGDAFKQSSSVFDAMMKKLKREGKGDVVHKSVISKEHQIQLNKYFISVIDTPKGLQHYVWYCIMMFLCRRGREGQRELTKDHFEIREIQGQKYIVQVS